MCVWESNRYHPFLHLSGRVNELSAVVRKNLSKNVSKKEVLQCISDMVVGVGIVSSLQSFYSRFHDCTWLLDYFFFDDH